MENIKYDIFISCKSEDYKYAEEVYDFLTENHFKTFLASKELRKLGDSQYRQSIEEALDTTEHLIVFASDPEYPKSKYVAYEWGLFVDEKISGRKEGNILTVLKDMNAGDLPIGLRRYESFQYETYKDSLLDYVETKEHQQRIKQIQEEEKLKEEQRKEDLEREKQKQMLLDKIKEETEEYVRKQSQIDPDIVKLRNMVRSLGIDKKRCKICDSELDLDDEFCTKCSWQFHPLEGIIGIEHQIKYNTKHIDFHKKLFANINKKATVKEEKSDSIENTLKQPEEKSKNYSLNKNDPHKYQVWALFCPSWAESLIRQYNKDFKNYGKSYVASFNSMSDAMKVKAELEGRGATVQIIRNSKVLYGNEYFC